MQKKVTVVGGLNIDIKAKSKSALVQGDSNPSNVEISAGGVGRNIAHNLALLGVHTTLLSAASNDGESNALIEQTKNAGVITEHLLISKRNKTGKYIAILDADGEMAMAVSDMDIFEELDIAYLQSKLDIIKQSDFLICDTNLSVESLKYLISQCRAYDIPICIDPVSAAKAVKLSGLLDGITILTPNRLELSVLSNVQGSVEEAGSQLVKLGVKNIITTLGPEGLCHIDANKSTYYSSIAKCITDVTGAGDSLTAGLIYGLLKCNDFAMACHYGLAAAAITLASTETVSSSLCEAELLILTGEI